MERASFKFFRSFYEAAYELEDKEQQADFLLAVCKYALDGVEPDIKGVSAAMFRLVKPNIDASISLSERGARGGENGKPTESQRKANLKPTQSQPKANPKPNESQTKANAKPTESQTEANLKPTQSQMKAEEGSRKKEEGSREVGSTPQTHQPKVQWAENVAMTNDEHDKLLATHGHADTVRLIQILDNYKGSSGKTYRSDYRAILSWCVDRLNEEKRKGGKEPPGAIHAENAGAVAASRDIMRRALERSE